MIVIMVALESELSRQPTPPGTSLVHSGVGKVNAAIATAMAIVRHQPSMLVNFGTAGAIGTAGVTGTAARGLVEVGSVIQRDMVAVPLAPRGVTPFDHSSPQITNGREGLRCATGDSFVNQEDPWLVEQKVDLVDMELFAIAHAANRFGVPWRAFKFVTDAANRDAAEEWRERVGDGELMFLEVVRSLSAFHESNRPSR